MYFFDIMIYENTNDIIFQIFYSIFIDKLYQNMILLLMAKILLYFWYNLFFIINNNLKEVILWILNNGMALIKPENGQKK